MLTIRDEQKAALRDSKIKCFAAEVFDHLMTHFPDPSAKLGGPPSVRQFVDRGIVKAQACGVDTPGAVTVLLELWIQFGEDFELSPLRGFSRNILAHRELPGAAKAELIRDRHLELTGGCVMISH